MSEYGELVVIQHDHKSVYDDIEVAKKMIECQYCYTRNDEDAPTCQACGGPLGERQETEEGAIVCPSPNNSGEFIQVGSTRPGMTCEEFVDAMSQMMRMW